MAEDSKSGRVSKNQRRRQKAKESKKATLKKKSIATNILKAAKQINDKVDIDDQNDVMEVESIVNLGPNELKQYEDILNKFIIPSNTNTTDSETTIVEKDALNDDEANAIIKKESIESNTEQQEQQVFKLDGTKSQLSKRKFMELHAIPLSDLKTIAKPFSLCVNWQDANAPDAYLHVYLKTLHNAVPVPRHWTSKKGFLSSRRGERRTFELPSFIKATGIQEMRNHGIQDNEDTLKQRMRARVQPKSGQLDLDFNVLYDAFFKHQIKPQLLKYGELYYEGIDGNGDQLTERAMAQYKPGKLSLELQKALGISNGALPPWFENVKQLGPAPEYSNMKVSERGIIYGNSRKGKRGPRWGVLVDDLDSDSEREDNEGKKSQNDSDSEDGGDGDYEAQNGDVLLNSYGESKPTTTQITAPNEDDDGKSHKLYQILHEKQSGDETSIYGSGSLAYDMKNDGNNKSPATPNNTLKSNAKHSNESQGGAKNFRF